MFGALTIDCLTLPAAAALAEPFHFPLFLNVLSIAFAIYLFQDRKYNRKQFLDVPVMVRMKFLLFLRATYSGELSLFLPSVVLYFQAIGCWKVFFC